MNGNKPPCDFGSAFTSRIAAFARTAYYPLPSRGCATAVVFVVDELLVGQAAAADARVTRLLGSLGAFDTGTTVFGGLTPRPREDVHVWRLKNAGGMQAAPDVAEAVWAARAMLTAHGIEPRQVAPNHVLVPAPNWHSCPWGPPGESSTLLALPAPQAPAVDVVVIDSGYTGHGPIVPRVQQPVDHCEWFSGTPTGSAGTFGPPYKWVAQLSEQNDADKDGKLDALVAHSDFVAGVVARACPRARITVANHNGAFVWHDDADTPIPTEASVARSLWKHRVAEVIHVGFAFPALPDAQLVPNSVDISGPPSWTFQLVLEGIDRQTMIVCPAGNQSCPVPQYPAAFHLDPQHENVVGVGSISPQRTRSSFSNFGSWVACCTEGENVRSTFGAGWNGPTEEAEPPGSATPGAQPSKHLATGWARWSGTSFAAPKVTAAIANGVGPGTRARSAWLALRAQHQSHLLDGADLHMGSVISALPPV